MENTISEFILKWQEKYFKEFSDQIIAEIEVPPGGRKKKILLKWKCHLVVEKKIIVEIKAHVSSGMWKVT